MYARILVPIDGSATSLKGLGEALKLAKALRAKVRLVHVINELLGDYTLTPSIYYEKMIEAERGVMRNWCCGPRRFQY